MTDLVAHGLAVSLPSGWEGRVFRRPAAGEVYASGADGAPAPHGETTHAVMHAATIALPPGVGDFASGAVDRLGPDDALVVLFEYDAQSAEQPLFANKGIPRQLEPDAFSPNVLQRTIRGQAGAQLFFNDSARAFCLYVVLGSHANRARLVPAVNQVLATLTIDASADAKPSPRPTLGSAAPSSTSTTEPPTSTEPPTTTPGPPTTPGPSTTTTPPTTTRGPNP
jgi:hypothetical protein